MNASLQLNNATQIVRFNYKSKSIESTIGLNQSHVAMTVSPSGLLFAVATQVRMLSCLYFFTNRQSLSPQQNKLLKLVDERGSFQDVEGLSSCATHMVFSNDSTVLFTASGSEILVWQMS